MYNVYLVLVDDFKAVQKVGENVNMHESKVIERTSMEGLNQLKYFSLTIPVGNERDLELSADLIK